MLGDKWCQPPSHYPFLRAVQQGNHLCPCHKEPLLVSVAETLLDSVGFHPCMGNAPSYENHPYLIFTYAPGKDKEESQWRR